MHALALHSCTYYVHALHHATVAWTMPQHRHAIDSLLLLAHICTRHSCKTVVHTSIPLQANAQLSNAQVVAVGCHPRRSEADQNLHAHNMHQTKKQTTS